MWRRSRRKRCGPPAGTAAVTNDCRERKKWTMRLTPKQFLTSPTARRAQGRRAEDRYPNIMLSYAPTPMKDVTRILTAVERGEPAAAERLLPLVYEELRRLAAQRLSKESAGQT